MTEQEQFLNVVDRDEAEQRFQAAVDLRPLGPENVSLDEALGRVLADDVVAALVADQASLDGPAAADDRPGDP